TTPHYAHTATKLQNGEVLVRGGFGSGIDCEDLGNPATAIAELYHPTTGAFESIGRMAEGRGGHTATLLANGKVLIAGGGDSAGSILPFYGTSSRTAEAYDPATGAFTPTGSMVTARFGHTATLLSDGKVLIAGGVESGDTVSQTTPTAELYDPSTGTFTPTGSLAVARAGHTATLLNDGKVLIAGGLTDTRDPALGTPTAEIYDPSTGTFSRTGDMGVAREAHTATLLANGAVLIAGGGLSSPTLFAEIYDPSTGSFTPTGAMGTGRVGHTATLLPDGRVLVAGGGYFLASAEIYK
ncbi:MAG: kelch-like protein, partial [Acidobacteriota bacterium]|nr:kelch-like protein [Acidobacteriota bacterium]